MPPFLFECRKVAIEFIGPSSVDELNSLGYQIEKIIFYDNEQ